VLTLALCACLCNWVLAAGGSPAQTTIQEDTPRAPARKVFACRNNLINIRAQPAAWSWRERWLSRYGPAAGAAGSWRQSPLCAALLEQALASLLAFSFQRAGQVAHIAWAGQEIPLSAQRLAYGLSTTSAPQLGHRISFMHFDNPSSGLGFGWEWPQTRSRQTEAVAESRSSGAVGRSRENSGEWPCPDLGQSQAYTDPFARRHREAARIALNKLKPDSSHASLTLSPLDFSAARPLPASGLCRWWPPSIRLLMPGPATTWSPVPSS